MEHEGWTEEEMKTRVLSNEDLKKIKFLKLRLKAKQADKSLNIDLKDYGFEVIDKWFI